MTSALYEIVSGMSLGTAERLEAHLTRADLDTLKDPIQAAIPVNTIRALISDIGYLQVWHETALHRKLVWPPSENTVLVFIAHHGFREEARAAAQEVWMPLNVEETLRDYGFLRAPLPLSPSTIKRRWGHGAGSHVPEEGRAA